MAEVKEIKQSPQEELVAAWVKQCWKQSETAARERLDVIKTCYEEYKNFGTHGKKSSKKASSRRNYIFSSVEDALALLTDNPPRLDFWPRSRDDIAVAEKYKLVQDFHWEVTKMMEHLPLTMRDFFIAGVGYLKIDFDPFINYPYGQMRIAVVPPLTLLPDPDATCMDDAKYMIQKIPMPIWKIRKEYPEKGKYVPPEDSISSRDDDPSFDLARTISADTSGESLGFNPENIGKHERAYVYEMWTISDAVFIEDELDEQGKLLNKAGDKKHPNGRKIVVANGIVLEDGENPFDDAEPPYVEFRNYDISGEYWPRGDVEYLIESNNDINKMASRLNDWVRESCHTVTVIDEEANVEKDSLDNIEGIVIPKSGQGKIERFSPPAMPPGLFQWLTESKSDLEVISGIREVLQGRKPDAGQSGVAFERLQEFAMSTIRKKARSIDNGILRLGKKMLSRTRQFMPENRQIRITGDFTKQTEDGTTKSMPYDFIDFSGRELYKQIPVMEPGTDMQMIDDIGQPVYTEEPIDLDVVMEVGSAETVTRNQERADAQFLFSIGVIDKEEVASRYKVKNYKELKERRKQEILEEFQIEMEKEKMKAHLQQQIQQEQMASMMGMGGMPGMPGMGGPPQGQPPPQNNIPRTA